MKEYTNNLYSYNEIQTKMQEIYDNYFSATLFYISVYVDYDLNTKADELWPNNNDPAGKANQLLDKIFEKADLVIDKDAIFDQVSEVITNYKIASLSDPTWGEFKSAGLHVTMSGKSSYNASSSINDALKDEIKALWLKIKEAENLGKTLGTDELDVEKSVNPVMTNTGKTKVVILSTSKPTNYGESLILPTEELIDKYLITQKPLEEKTDEELRISLTTKEKNTINAYYLPAIQDLQSQTKVQLALIAERKSLLDAGTISFNNPEDQTRYFDLIEITKADLEG